MKCPLCGLGPIVWDWSRGDVICSSCGVVIDRIYDESHETISKRNSKDEGEGKGPGGIRMRIIREKENLLRRKYIKSIRRIDVYASIVVKRKGIIVNEEAFKEYLMGLRPRVRILAHEKDYELKKVLNENPALQRMFRLIDKVPKLSSRTFRGKFAAAYILHELARDAVPDIDTIAKITGLSSVHVRRITNEISKYKKLIEYAKKMLSSYY